MVTLKEIGTALWINLNIIFLFTYPLILIFVFFIDIYDPKGTVNAWLYTVLVMVGYWLFEPVPLCATALIPLVFFPLMGVLSTSATGICYFYDLNMTMLGGLIFGLVMETSNLNKRISLQIIKRIGFRYRFLNMFLTITVVVMSMWLSNTITICLMLPIIKGVLQQLEECGLAKMWEQDESKPDIKLPTRVTKCFYIGAAYTATIGGLGTLMGSGTNLAFHDLVYVGFGNWLALNFVPMLAILILTWGLFQWWYMGMLRPSSNDFWDITFTIEEMQEAERNLEEKLEENGKITYYEIIVSVLLGLAVVGLFFRRATFMDAWPSWITETIVTDSSVLMPLVILLYIFPARLEFLQIFNQDESERPQAPSPSLITWKYTNKNAVWSAIFTNGAVIAIAEAVQKNKYYDAINDKSLNFLSQTWAILVTALVSTQFMINSDLVKILIPLISSVMQRFDDVHEMRVMVPAVLGCSFAFLLPIATPPNAIMCFAGNIRAIEYFKIGLLVFLISLAITFSFAFSLAPQLWDSSYNYTNSYNYNNSHSHNNSLSL